MIAGWRRPLFLAALLGLSAVAGADTARRPSRQYTIEQFMATTSVRDSSFSPDEMPVLFSSNASGIVEYVVFPDEGHGFSKRKNQIEAYGKIRAFLDKYLKETPAAAAPAGK
jgi:hypothetical protein